MTFGQLVPCPPNTGHSYRPSKASNLFPVYNIREAAKETGYTVNQLRERLAALTAYLDGDLQRGPQNAIILTEHGLDLIRRLADLEASGLSFPEALAKLQKDGGIGEARLALTENEQHSVKVGEDRQPSVEVSATFAEGGQRSANVDIDAELIHILWTLTTILGVGVAAMVGLGIAALLTR